MLQNLKLEEIASVAGSGVSWRRDEFWSLFIDTVALSSTFGFIAAKWAYEGRFDFLFGNNPHNLPKKRFQLACFATICTATVIIGTGLKWPRASCNCIAKSSGASN